MFVERPEEVRGCKEILRRAMGERSYKETRDQVRFVTALDFDLLRAESRSFQRFERMLFWLADCQLGAGSVHPDPALRG